MANEVIIEEYQAFDAKMQIPTKWLTTQVINAGAVSAALNANTTYIRVRSNTTAFWYKFGTDNSVTASAASGSSRVAGDGVNDHAVTPNTPTYIGTL